MILHGHQSFRGAVLWGWLKRFSLQFHFIHWFGYVGAWIRRGLDTTWLELSPWHNRHQSILGQVNVRLHSSPTALDTLLPLDGSLCNFISFIGWATLWLDYHEVCLPRGRNAEDGTRSPVTNRSGSGCLYLTHFCIDYCCGVFGKLLCLLFAIPIS